MANLISEQPSGGAGVHVRGVQTAPASEVTLMDIWLVVRSRGRIVLGTIVAFVVGGVALAFLTSPVYRITTAIEIGNQVVNQLIVPIEPSTSVMAKLENGYIPTVTSQMIASDPNGPQRYVIDVIGSKDSQIVTIASEATKDLAPKHMTVHRQIVDALVKDHNRTADAMRDNARSLLSEAEEKLGSFLSEEKALTEQLKNLDGMIGDIARQSKDLEVRINSAEKELDATKGGGNSTDKLLLSSQIGEWRSALLQKGQKDLVTAFVQKSETSSKLDNITRLQDTARNAIKFRQTMLDNISATRAVGSGTIMSVRPVAPDKPLYVAVSLLLGIIVGVAGALILDFLDRAKGVRQAQL